MTKTFYIQTANEQPIHDFTFHLLEAIRFHAWLNTDPDHPSYTFRKSDTSAFQKGMIPVGSLEFVEEHWGAPLIPDFIPHPLRHNKFLKRRIRFLSSGDLTEEVLPAFVKRNDMFKSSPMILSSLTPLEEGEYLISEVVTIQSEWRAFVFHNRLVGLHPYSGDPTVFPDAPLIHRMIEDYDHSPLCYTLDVGVNDDGTFLIESHPFISCGLYGFQNYKILPQMFVAGYLGGTKKT
ncbi:ATP-grasp domain-containing protein (plasmid) [Pontibacillus sp. ALD_SL1]|uniref:ATP-grasp domain-containing protein n=1 Tax=Pontibacillus sp. ALD_SL1 TaxID=2777185 RepID=UPI001A966A3B|nr:ATP-grasp domain-containing protein [Pontibacillus sp. ALD_SL1]QST02298.1 ATP-grasp domain-containing protein [Pontibacillus sp. ALD_SL1]